MIILKSEQLREGSCGKGNWKRIVLDRGKKGSPEKEQTGKGQFGKGDI